MIPTDLFILTPFHREQIDMGSSFCESEPDIPFTSYSVYVFRSRLEAFLKKYFSQTNRKKYNYDQFVFRDIPYDGRMVTTIILNDSDSKIISLTPQEIRDINLEISEMIVLHPDYLLFLEDSTLQYPQAWLRTILPSLEFQRISYLPFDGTERYSIPSIYYNGCIYLNLIEDESYLSTIQSLYKDTLNQLDEFYHKGTLPTLLEYTGSGVTVTIKNPGDFIQIEEKLGDQVLEDMAGLEEVVIPESDFKMTTEIEKSDEGEATVFVINYSRIDMNLEFLENQLGVEFLVSLKKFLDADEIITKKVNPGYYEIVAKKDGKFLTSNLDVKEMFGFSYFTDDPLGLMVLDDMNLLDDTKAIYDSASGKGAIFVPTEKFGDVIQVDYLIGLLNNKKQFYDAYTESTDIELTLMRLGLDVESRIDKYLFVKKDRWITKRLIYRGLSEKNPKMCLSGDWNFEEMSSKDILSLGQQLMYELDNDGELKEGPYDTIIVPVISKDFIENFSRLLKEKIHQKYKPARKF